MTDENSAPPKLNTLVPHPARVYDYWLGGKDNFEADRQVAEAVIAASPVLCRVSGTTARSWAEPCDSSPNRGSTSFWTSAPAFRPRATPTRSPRP
nr:SAM-dependent methyltransferase [Microbispora sp. H11081]